MVPPYSPYGGPAPMPGPVPTGAPSPYGYPGYLSSPGYPLQSPFAFPGAPQGPVATMMRSIGWAAIVWMGFNLARIVAGVGFAASASTGTLTSSSGDGFCFSLMGLMGALLFGIVGIVMSFASFLTTRDAFHELPAETRQLVRGAGLYVGIGVIFGGIATLGIIVSFVFVGTLNDSSLAAVAVMQAFVLAALVARSYGWTEMVAPFLPAEHQWRLWAFLLAEIAAYPVSVGVLTASGAGLAIAIVSANGGAVGGAIAIVGLFLLRASAKEAGEQAVPGMAAIRPMPPPVETGPPPYGVAMPPSGESEGWAGSPVPPDPTVPSGPDRS